MAAERRPTFAAVAFAAALAAVAAPARAAGPPPGPPDTATIGTASKPGRLATKSAPTHAWHDGTAPRTLTLEPGWMADFSPTGVAPGPVLRRTDANVSAPAAFASPVLRDDAGRLRALPGGVLVTTHAPMDDASAALLLRRAGVGPGRRLGATLWLVEGPPGLASLEAANRLHGTGLFASAQPNWWVQRTTK